VAPGRRNGSAIMVVPPKPAWVGRPVQRRFEITSTVIGSETGALPKAAYLTQKPWIPMWALLLVPLLLIAAIAAYLLWPRTSTVPDLAGLEVIAAEQTLADAGLTLGNQTPKANDKAKAGTILAQSPESGKSVDDGSAVSVVIATSSGKAKVPDVSGKTLEEANALISKAGFSLAPPTPPPAPTDVVASQIPLAGNVEPQTTPITLAFKPAPKKGETGTGGGGKNGGKGGGGGGGGGTGGVVVLPGKIEVPDLDGVAQKDAFAALTKLGLVPKIGEQFSSEVKAGDLVHQKPEHGTKVGKGSTVLLVYSKGDAQVVYDQKGNLFLASAVAAGDPVPLANSEQAEEEPTINPDGTLVAYRRGNDTEAQIWTVKPGDPSSAKPLTTETGFNDNRPAFSPDGKTVAFVRSKAGPGERDLCFVAAAGGKAACIADPNRSVTRPVWSPDGTIIFVAASNPQTETQVELLRYKSAKPFSASPSDWTDQGYVTDSLHGQRAGEFTYFATFSPDGKQLAFTANWGSTFSHLFIATVKNGALEKPKEYPSVRGCSLSWRKDGLELAISDQGADCRADGQIFRVDPKNPAEQTQSRAGKNPVWTPVQIGTG
jgi:beta-lactam-binding protein with PASTA domain